MSKLSDEQIDADLMTNPELLYGPDEGYPEYGNRSLRLAYRTGYDAALCKQDLRALLAPIDWALRSGSRMTRANLALERLCEQVGVDRDALNPALGEHSSNPREDG